MVLETPEIGLLVVTVAFMLLDIVTGLAKGAKAGALDSKVMREGLWHKAGFVGLVALAYALQFASGVADLGIDVPAVSAVCVFIILTEAVSVAENLCALNPAIASSPLGKVLAGHGSGTDGDAQSGD